MKKGIWYYEIQILMLVILWQHSTYKTQRKSGIHIKRLYIWYDAAWLSHGAGLKLFDMYVRTMGAFSFVASFTAFISLYRAGFRITRSNTSKGGPNGLVIHRFWWKGKIIRDMADIDCINGKDYNTVRNGHVEHL